MRYYLIIFGIVFCISIGLAQQDSLVLPESRVMDLDVLLSELMMNNQEVQAALTMIDMTQTRVAQEGSLDAPTFEFMQDQFPGLQFGEAMMSKYKLMQMIPFPGKLAGKGALAEMKAEHSHHDQYEMTNAIIAKFKGMYFELWYIQESIILMQENIRLMKQFSETALSNYSLGKSSQQDVLKTGVEISTMNNEIINLRAKELGMKAMMAATLNRSASDTLGYAQVSEDIAFSFTLDSLESLALSNRQMLKHDSLSIIENEAMLSLTKKEYLPDFTFAIERDISPMTDFTGWSISAGITLPFVPWVLGKNNAMVEEATLGIKKAREDYNSNKNMVLGSVRELYAKIDGLRQQLQSYGGDIIPKAQQSLNVSLSLYQNGKTDFLMLIDAFRSLSDLRMKYYMVRMDYEQAVVELERAVGGF